MEDLKTITDSNNEPFINISETNGPVYATIDVEKNTTVSSIVGKRG